MNAKNLLQSAPSRFCRLFALWGLTLGGSLPVAAQGIPSAADAPREGEEIRGNTKVAEIREVERGVYVGVNAGMNYYFPIEGAGFVTLNEGWLTPGSRMEVRVGYDLLNNVQVEGFLLANFNTGTINGQRLAEGKLTGDIAHFAPGIAARFAFVTTDRIFAYGRAGLGYALWFPQELAANSFGSLHTEVALGVEYYTRLRHISVGIEGAMQALLFPNAFGVQIYPTLKYTF
jgi:hypothetical protein